MTQGRLLNAEKTSLISVFLFFYNKTKNRMSYYSLIAMGRTCSLVAWFLWCINRCRLFNAKFYLYVFTFNQGFLNEYLVGKIFYGQDFTCLHMINQF